MGPSVCCHVLAVCVAVMATICCANRAQYFITGTNRRCSGVLPDVFTAVSAVGCCRKCLGESSCLAVNYSPTTMECQLCDGTVENDPVVAGQDAWRVYLITGQCEEGWMYYDSSCYMIKHKLWPWDTAREQCMALGARLVEIGNQQENAFLVALLESEGVFPDFIIWIGLNDMDVEGTLVWPSGAPVSFKNIPAAHQDSATERCYTMVESGVWHELSCGQSAYSVCEKPALQ